MNGAELELLADVRGCANCQKEESSAFVTRANLERYVVKLLWYLFLLLSRL